MTVFMIDELVDDEVDNVNEVDEVNNDTDANEANEIHSMAMTKKTHRDRAAMDIPPEIVFDVLQYLSLYDISNLALVNHWLYNLIVTHKESLLLKFYRYFFALPGSNSMTIPFFNSMLPYFNYEPIQNVTRLMHSNMLFIFASLVPYEDVRGHTQFMNIDATVINETSISVYGWIENEIFHGHMGSVEWYFTEMVENNPDCLGEIATIDVAAKYNHLDIIKWIHYQGYGPESTTPNAMDYAASNGHLSVVIWLHENRDEGCSTEAMDLAAMNGYLNVVRWLHANRSEGCSADALCLAASNGHACVVHWFLENRRDVPSERGYYYAALHGHFNVIKVLHELRVSVRGCTQAMDAAASKGHLGIFAYLYNRGHRCSPAAFNEATSNGHLGVVEFLLRHELQGDIITGVKNAQQNGHYHLVDFFQNEYIFTGF